MDTRGIGQAVHWDDLKYVMAIAHARTLTAAARQLKVDQTTVSRRLKSIEERLGAALFLRAGPAMTPTDLCQLVVEHAERMEREVLRLSEIVELGDVRPHGSVRISTMPWIVNNLILPKIKIFTEHFPDIEIDLISGVRERVVSKREADIALRFEFGARGREETLPIGPVPYALYAPAKSADKNTDWILFGDDMQEAAIARHIEKQVKEKDRIVLRCNDAENVYEAIRNGIGKGLIPERLGEKDKKLKRLSGAKPEFVRELRLIVHPDIRRLNHVGHVINWLREELITD